MPNFLLNVRWQKTCECRLFFKRLKTLNKYFRDESLEILNTSFILLIFLFLSGYKDNKIFWYNGLQMSTQGQVVLENNCLFYQNFHSSAFADWVFMLKNVLNFEFLNIKRDYVFTMKWTFKVNYPWCTFKVPPEWVV